MSEYWSGNFVRVRDDEYARDPSTGTYTANYESQMTQPSVSQLMLDDRDAHSQAYVEAYAEPLSEAIHLSTMQSILLQP